MARNNRYDVLDRLQKGGARVLLNAPVESIEASKVWAKIDGKRTPTDASDMIIVAIGPLPNRDVVPEVERARAQYVLAGDCNQIGDFLAAVRDGWMVATAVDLRLPAPHK